MGAPLMGESLENPESDLSPTALEGPMEAPPSKATVPGRPRRYPTPLTAYLTANKPPEGNHRESWYLYDVEFEGEVIVKNSKDAECDAARALLARGMTGKLTMVDAKTGKPRTFINIEKAAKLTVSETRSHGPRFARWTPNPWSKHP